MNIIALDPSLISTALIVNGKMFNYCRESKVFGKTGMTKWFKLAEKHITYRFIEYRSFKDYSEGELIKLKDYDNITDMILKDIFDNIDIDKPTKVGIEGYSFSSKNGDIIDLVTYSTLLRKKLWDQLTHNIVVMSPSTLKLESCKLTYRPLIKEIGKKKKREVIEYKNSIGVSGGKFTKGDMFMAIIDNDQFNDPWSIHCKLHKDEIRSTKEIQKPYEDMNDSFLIYRVLEKQIDNDKNKDCKL
jgi:hypothetical protein